MSLCREKDFFKIFNDMNRTIGTAIGVLEYLVLTIDDEEHKARIKKMISELRQRTDDAQNKFFILLGL